MSQEYHCVQCRRLRPVTHNNYDSSEHSGHYSLYLLFCLTTHAPEKIRQLRTNIQLSFNIMSPGGLLTATVLAVPLLLLLPHLMPTVARAVGSHIRQSGQQRKELLTARASIERKQYEEQDDPASLDDEWEKVDRSHAQAKNGAGRADGRQADQDWDGVVGFFHPFWLESLLPLVQCRR